MLNEKIREIRTAKKMSQVELANILGVTKQSVSNWENDNIQPSIEMLAKLAKALSVSTDYLLGIDERRYLDVTGLSESEAQHIQLLIEDIKNRKG
ncbi:MAG: helix-turn-helix domain-containing protein [Acutalibacteraceae bacterium]